MVALSAKQQLQIQNLMAAQYRAQALEEARARAEASQRMYNTWDMQEEHMVKIHISSDTELSDWAVAGAGDDCVQQFRSLEQNLGVDYTGITFLSYALVGKRVELLHEVQDRLTGQLRSAHPYEIRHPKTREPIEVRDPATGAARQFVDPRTGAVRLATPADRPPNKKSLGRVNEIGTLFATLRELPERPIGYAQMTTSYAPLPGTGHPLEVLRFRFDGRDYEGYQGDTLASALLANGVHQVTTSIKHGRPRGIMAAGPEEPNALVQIDKDTGQPRARV